MTFMDTAGYYDPIQYPLLFPYGSYGWSINSLDTNGRTIPCRAFYAYLFQIRLHVISIILLAGRLFQQFIVDNFVKIEANKLRWLRDHQDTIRAELYQGLQDCLDAGELNPVNAGKKTILPSSFVGSPRDMNQRYQDAMALVQHYGKPDLFVTMTCNPTWREIVEELLPGQTPQDRPDLITRIFHAKFEEFKSDVVDKSALGKVVAYVYVVEFQKSGLPHVHMLLILDENDKPRSPEEYDKIVRAEIPDRDEEPRLYDVVLKHMIHKPCGAGRRNSSCMENGVCKRKFPKSFSASTIQGDNSYPIYRRRGDRPAVPLHENSTTYVDNKWVVPYNSWLLLKYDCHINVEICSSIKCVKYLYKYVHKGVDRVSMEVRTGSENNEIQQFVDARWVCAPEALWRIYQFTLTRMCPSVERLQLHLQNRQQIRFNTNQSIEDILQMPQNSRTMLTEFFKMNVSDPEARKYLYIEFPQHYRWLTSSKNMEKKEE
ncbi:uncharacterized protein [Spinacia oleracea]|uniref:Helitron helicase-like domain-containing protein n=1 Tax=Spinacia oleracea TaxID=3562 RepID=A0A9R0HRK7_SPIOL|nr:uncharacterized protein LOC110775303 [Spinacia oleracea]